MLGRPQDHSAIGRIMPMENSNDTIGNRTHELPACNAVPQPTAPLRAPTHDSSNEYINFILTVENNIL